MIRGFEDCVQGCLDNFGQRFAGIRLDYRPLVGKKWFAAIGPRNRIETALGGGVRVSATAKIQVKWTPSTIKLSGSGGPLIQREWSVLSFLAQTREKV